MGNNVGVIIAAILLTVLTETLRRFGDYRMVLYSALLIVLMLTRPEGIFPNRQRAVEMRGEVEEELDQLGEDALIDRPLGGVRA